MALRIFLLFAMSVTLATGQRPGFAGSRPIGYPEVYNRTTTTTEGLGDRFGEDATTQRLPLEANGDRELIDRLSKLPVDKQPFWFINWQALEANRNKPQTYPQRPNQFIDPIPNAGTGNIGTNPPANTGSNLSANQVPNSNTASTKSESSVTSTNTGSNQGSNSGTLTSGIDNRFGTAPNSNSPTTESNKDKIEKINSEIDKVFNAPASTSNSPTTGFNKDKTEKINSEIDKVFNAPASNSNSPTTDENMQNCEQSYSEIDSAFPGAWPCIPNNAVSEANRENSEESIKTSSNEHGIYTASNEQEQLPTQNHFIPKLYNSNFRPRNPIID